MGHLLPPILAVTLMIAAATLSIPMVKGKKTSSSKKDAMKKQQCATFGYADSLTCSTCNKMKQAVGKEGKNAVKECKSCCQSDGAISYIQGVFSLCD
mgnify:FL=1|jgi:hypothetical protein